MVNMISSFNKIGARLIRATKNVPVTNAEKAIIPNAVTSDFVTVQTKFGAKTTDILSFNDENGKLIKRFRTTRTKGSDIVERMEGNYRPTDPDFGGIHTKRKYYINNKLIKDESIEQWTKWEPLIKRVNEYFNNVTKHSFISKLNNKFINLIAIRQNNGFKGNKVYSEITSNLAQKDIDKLKKLPYLHEFDLDGRDFLEAIFPQAVKSQKFKYFKKPKLEIKNLKKNRLGVAKGFNVTVDANKESDKFVNTLYHELRHVKQSETMVIGIVTNILQKCKIFRKSISKDINKLFGNISNNSINYSKKCLTARKKYTQPEKDFNKYYNNFLEVDARKAGGLAQKEYDKQYNIFYNILHKYGLA